MKKILLIFSFIFATGILALLIFFRFTATTDDIPTAEDPAFSGSAGGDGSHPDQHQQNLKKPRGRVLGLPVNQHDHSQEISAPTPQHKTSDSTAASLPSIADSYTVEETHDIMFVADIMEKMTKSGILTLDELVAHTRKKGYTPFLERQGHEKTGFRRVVKISELSDSNRMIREFYGAYYEHGSELVFDRFYYGLTIKEHLYEQLVKEIDERLHKNYARKILRESKSRWDFRDGSFIFIHAEYDKDGSDKIILIGKEWEIH